MCGVPAGVSIANTCVRLAFAKSTSRRGMGEAQGNPPRLPPKHRRNSLCLKGVQNNYLSERTMRNPRGASTGPSPPGSSEHQKSSRKKQYSAPKPLLFQRSQQLNGVVTQLRSGYAFSVVMVLSAPVFENKHVYNEIFEISKTLIFTTNKIKQILRNPS